MNNEVFIMKSRVIRRPIVAIVVALFAMLSIPRVALSADLVVDNFEQYLSSQVIGASWQSVPWLRFGPATIDNVLTTADEQLVISGGISSVYTMSWPARFGAVRRVLETPTDLSRFKAAGIKIRSDRPDTATHVKIAVSNGTTTFATIETFPLTTNVQEIVTGITGGEMVRTDGSQNFVDVIKSAKLVGLDFISNMETYTETVLFDDLILFEQKPQEAAQAQAQTQGLD